jgi:tRNA/tmRNA/rRNA uracil-C5-methylase (TrmA/RlmC/RlmD family)
MRSGISARSGPSASCGRCAGPDWNYRQRARLSVRHVVKKGTVLVGFHERKSSFVAEIGAATSCRATSAI